MELLEQVRPRTLKDEEVCGYCGGDGGETGVAGSVSSPNGYTCVDCLVAWCDGAFGGYICTAS